MTNAHRLYAYKQHAKSMSRRPKQEPNKEFLISISDACTNPWTVMIMKFNTDSALVAVE
tara:strand:+ start:348 stop:524 length:177 start_codon:yes stop_codon:yes gene_type:complete